MTMEDKFEEIRAHFKLVCKKCNSEDITIYVTDGQMGSEETGWMEGMLSITCQGCSNNDLIIYDFA